MVLVGRSVIRSIVLLRWFSSELLDCINIGIIFLIFIWLFSMWDFGVCVVFKISFKFIKNRFRMKKCCVFYIGVFASSSFIKRFNLYTCGFILVQQWFLSFVARFSPTLCISKSLLYLNPFNVFCSFWGKIERRFRSIFSPINLF